jgi:hypothetical protein
MENYKFYFENFKGEDNHNKELGMSFDARRDHIMMYYKGYVKAIVNCNYSTDSNKVEELKDLNNALEEVMKEVK